jgi:hypothetical protein
MQLRRRLAGEDAEGEGRRVSNAGHDGEADGSWADAGGVDQATSGSVGVGHDRDHEPWRTRR